MSITLADLRAANITRQEEWCPDQKPDLSFRGNELAGESGEACNQIKKLERDRHGWRGSKGSVAQLAEELADTVICADLVAITAGIDLEASVVAKFNATSDANNLRTRLPAQLGSSTQPLIESSIAYVDSDATPEPISAASDDSPQNQSSDARALKAFIDYFIRNYPGPDTVIFDPKWHAPKIFRAALQAIRDAQSINGNLLSNALEMTGCENEEDLIDMANVGRSLMDKIGLYTKAPSLLEDWSPADDPAEIVGDLYNRLEESLACHRQALDEAKTANAIIGQIETIFPNWRAYRDLVDCVDSSLPLVSPHGFRWLDRPITVTGGDYRYDGQLLCSFPKAPGGAVRYIVRDGNGRLFIHNAAQCGLEVSNAN
ncbi:MazG-like family protein [Rhizobium sp. WW_1]|uniref:MazG-like family protein n=1 Tax=Rhizobium sp. WW_1 TaxID=1907375 RepID=UPI00068F789B|nr:MazG-like family protein [Rhizobium sp. WW_1]RKD61691.1 hypothetical protein BJ928_107293 [Rhizobium sp. WW_1]